MHSVPYIISNGQTLQYIHHNTPSDYAHSTICTCTAHTLRDFTIHNNIPYIHHNTPSDSTAHTTPRDFTIHKQHTIHTSQYTIHHHSIMRTLQYMHSTLLGWYSEWVTWVLMRLSMEVHWKSLIRQAENKILVYWQNSAEKHCTIH